MALVDREILGRDRPVLNEKPSTASDDASTKRRGTAATAASSALNVPIVLSLKTMSSAANPGSRRAARCTIASQLGERLGERGQILDVGLVERGELEGIRLAQIDAHDGVPGRIELSGDETHRLRRSRPSRPLFIASLHG